MVQEDDEGLLLVSSSASSKDSYVGDVGTCRAHHRWLMRMERQETSDFIETHR